MNLCLIDKIKEIMKNTIIKNNIVAERFNLFKEYIEEREEYRDLFLSLLNHNVDYSLGYDDRRIYFFYDNEIIYLYEFYLDEFGNIIDMRLTDNSEFKKEKKLTRS